MGSVLLLGAGFSKNWGAPVASEFLGQLLADHEIQQNFPMRNLLWDKQNNFEEALNLLQQNYQRDRDANREQLQLFFRAMLRIFDRMTTIFHRQQLDLQQDTFYEDRSRRVVEFLAQFDAIFTLNQDLLLEIHYFDHAHNMTTNRRWSGSNMPGMASKETVQQNRPWSGRTWIPDGDVQVKSNTQPYFKLHGSRNWRSADNSEDIIIMGGGKDAAIRQFPVLQRYQDYFAEYITPPSTRVVVIGYGFGDDHINKVLRTGVEDNGLKMYVIDPLGAGLAYERNPIHKNQIIGPRFTELETWFQKGLYSASTIPFRQLLIGESVDREVLLNFMSGK